MSAADPVVLVIEDEPNMRRFLRTALVSHHHQVVEAGTAREGLAQAAGRNPDVILLDLGLPDGDGLDLTTRIRQSTRAPIIVISARGREEDQVTALDRGADDYLTKPFGVGELLARIRVALRHAALPPDGPAEAIYSAGDVEVDLVKRQVRRGGKEVRLTPTEYKLLAALIRQAGKVVTHRQLLHEVWGANFVDQIHYLRVYMVQLRHKLESDPARPRLLKTEPGVGYRLADEGERP
jgi:two-component system KDP operon response regulator KdpE